MVRYTSTRQLSFTEFRTPFTQGLDGTNRWVRLAQQVPWDELARIYIQSLREDFGRPSVDARIVIGSMIIKHIKHLADEETLEEIQENPYLQFFLGLEEFTHQRLFDPSLFVTLRKRMGADVFEQLNQIFIDKIESAKSATTAKKKSKHHKNSSESSQQTSEKNSSDTENTSSKEQAKNQGKLIIDASVAPQDIKYPTDLDLLNDSREQTERIIDTLYQPEPGKRKPRTYRKNARKDYLATARKRRKSKKALRKAIRKQLNYVKRNIKTIHQLLDENPHGFPFRLLRNFWIVQEIYRQQKEMYDNHSHQISDRIVSVSQPHVRPIVRGKSGKDVEFGAKLSVSLVNGFVHLDRISWDAYNESNDLIDQVENYYRRYGCYPASVIVDQIYGTRKNRSYLNSKNIRFCGKQLGRPPKLSKEEKRMMRIEARLRSQIEGKFGEGKRKYDLGLVKTKTMVTSESWIAAIFFVMNIARWLREDFFVLFLKPIFSRILNNFKEHLMITQYWSALV